MANSGLSARTDVIVERTIRTPAENYDVCLSDPVLADCLDLYRIEWCESFLSVDQRRLVCRFRAPDAECVRMLLRNAGTGGAAVWAGWVLGTTNAEPGKVIVEHRFHERVAVDADEVLSIVTTERLAPIGLELRHAIVSRDLSRILCICHCRDSLIQFRGQGWRCRHLLPRDRRQTN